VAATWRVVAKSKRSRVPGRQSDLCF